MAYHPYGDAPSPGRVGLSSAGWHRWCDASGTRTSRWSVSSWGRPHEDGSCLGAAPWRSAPPHARLYAKERTMALEHRTDIVLPAHRQPGGFDHAAVNRASARLYVAHTANDAVDVIDCARDRYLHSIAGLTGVAGALVSDARPLVFTSNRGEHTVGIFAPDAEEALVKVPVGIGPNGLAYDPGRNLLLAANVGDPERPGSHTVSLGDVDTRALVASVAVPGRTRWTVFDPRREVFFVNISEPAQIIVIDARNPTTIATSYGIPAAGPHGLDLDMAHGRLFCACDAQTLVCLEAH